MIDNFERADDTVRIVDLDDFDETCEDDAVVTLQLLVMLKGESHRRWRIIPHPGGAWDYEKVQP